MRRNLLQPFDLDFRNRACEQTRGFNQFTRHHPRGIFFAHAATGPQIELNTARTCVKLSPLAEFGLLRLLLCGGVRQWFGFIFKAHIPQQPREQSAVQLLIGRFSLILTPSLLQHLRAQLAVDIAPLAQS